MKFSDKLSIESVDYASQGNAILGIRNSGKSYTATFIAERLMDDGIPFIAFDPIGIWRYLKVGKQGAGYPVVVAGDNGDLPLTPQSAPAIVRAAMKENVSLVLDLYSMSLSKKDWRDIVENCIRLLLYENKPCGLRHIFIEEAAEFCPQRVQAEQGRVYAEVEKLARMGGNASLGYTLINQRPEEVNKAVLELCDCLFLHRQKGRHSLTALGKWLDVASTRNAEKVMSSLPSLEQGQCWVWSEGSHSPVFIAIPEKRTVHPDRKNPLLASAGVTSDVSTFVSRMDAWLVAQTAKDAPAKKKAAQDSGDEDQMRIFMGIIEAKDATIVHLEQILEERDRVLDQVQTLLERLPDWRKPRPATPPTVNKSILAALKPVRPEKLKVPEADETGKPLGKCAKAILTFLAPFERGFTKVQIGICIGYSPTSGGFANALSELWGRELIIRDKVIRANRDLMEDIVSIVGPVKKIKYNINTFKEKLGKCEREIYDVLLSHPKRTFTRSEIADLTVTKYSVTSGGFSNSLSKLCTLDIMIRDDGNFYLHPDLAKML